MSSLQDVSEFDTLAEYKEELKENILKMKKENEAKRTKEDEAIQKIIDKSTDGDPGGNDRYTV